MARVVMPTAAAMSAARASGPAATARTNGPASLGRGHAGMISRLRHLFGGGTKLAQPGAAALRSLDGRRVDHLHPARLHLLNRGLDVVHFQADVVHPGAALFEETRQPRIVAGGLHQLHFAAADRQESCFCHFCGDILDVG